MAKQTFPVEINGVTYPTEAETAAEAMQLAEQTAAAQPVTATGLGKAGATGTRTGLEELVAAPANLVTAEMAGIARLAEMMGASPETVKKIREYGQETGTSRIGIPSPGMATSEDVRGATDSAVKAVLPKEGAAAVQDVTRHVPQNTAEEWAQTGGEFAPMVLSGPEGWAAKGTEKLLTKAAAPNIVKSVAGRVANAAVPAIATEGAGQAARAAGAPPGLEGAVRLVTGFLSGGGLEHGMRRGIDRHIKAIVDAGPEAVQSVFDSLKAQGMTGEDAAARMRELGLPGVQSMVMDTGTSTVHQAQNIHARGGPGRAIIDEPLKARDPLINQGLETVTEGTVGARKQPSTVVKALEDRLDEAGKRQQAAHSQQVQDVDLGAMADELDTQIASEKDPGLIGKLRSVRELLNAPEDKGGGLETGSERVLKVRQAIKGMLYDSQGRPRDLNESEAGALNYYYGKTNEAIDPANPTLRAADADIQQVKKEGEAFETGQKVYENPRGALTEVEFKQAFDKMTPGEQQAVMDGINVETWRQIGISRNNLVKLQDLIKGEGKWNHEKIAGVFGEDKAKAMMDAIGNAKQLRENYNDIARGSKTASATASTRVPQPERPGKLSRAIDVMSPRLAHAKQFIQEMLAKGPTPDPAMSDQAARVLAMNDPDKIMELADLLASRKKTTGGGGKPVLAALLARQNEVSERKDQLR